MQLVHVPPPGQLPDRQPVEREELCGVREHQLDSGAHKEVPQVQGAEQGGQRDYSKGEKGSNPESNP